MLLAIALGSALASLIALNVGAKQYKRTKQTLKYAIILKLILYISLIIVILFINHII